MTKIMDEPQEKFFGRADAHIHLSNDQAKNAKTGNVSASMLFGTSRYNAYTVASGFATQAEFEQESEKAIDYLVDQYRKMLKENMSDYLTNFDSYIKQKHS